MHALHEFLAVFVRDDTAARARRQVELRKIDDSLQPSTGPRRTLQLFQCSQIRQYPRTILAYRHGGIDTAALGANVKLDQDIASGLMSINAVKGVEIGNGFESAEITGEENADEMRIGPDGKPQFLSNNAGGILGGISNGEPIVARFAVKPTSSILTERQSIDSDGNEVMVRTKGRHDPCVGIRAVPIGEAMVACAIADHYLRDRGQTGRLD